VSIKTCVIGKKLILLKALVVVNNCGWRVKTQLLRPAPQNHWQYCQDKSCWLTAFLRDHHILTALSICPQATGVSILACQGSLQLI